VLAGNIIDMGNGKYRLRVSNGFDLNGKRKYYNKTVSCASKREAEKELARFITSIEGGCTYSASKTTLNEYSQMWLQTYVMPNLSPTTYQSYNEKLNKHILPYLGSKRLDKIKPLDLDNLYNFLLTKPTNRKDNLGNFKTLSPASVHRVHEILSSIFNNALRWDLVPYNPCIKVVQPKYRRTKMSCYDEETSKRLINTLLAKAPIKYKCFVILAILTGFRRGEIVGLHWDDIDFKNHKITVNRSAYYLSGQPTSEKGPKTDTSNRTIVVPKLCFDLLKQWRAEQGKMRLAIGDKWQGAENIFTTDNGRIMNPSTGPKWFSDFLEKNNFPHIRFHDLRHTFATLLISGNVDVKTVSHKLGHASPTTTMNFYVHSLESTDRASAELLENMLIKENNL
jgi:integrase